MNNNLLFGYYAISPNNLWDFGNEPYFHTIPFSWGICRPNCRGKIGIGTKIFFYTFKASAGDYFLTGMMKVDRCLTQLEAANDPELYCNREKHNCQFKLIPYPNSGCKRDNKSKIEKRNNLTIARRTCRCNIVVNPYGKYKEFCDGGVHYRIYERYLDKRIYFVSTREDSVATKNRIRVLDYIDAETKFWNPSRFHGYEIPNDIAVQFENILRNRNALN